MSHAPSFALPDAAQIAMWLVDWSKPSLHVLLSSGTLGEVRREGDAFTCEMRGLADRLRGGRDVG